MLEIIEWLISNEEKASAVYYKAASILKGDAGLSRFLETLGAEERVHAEVMRKAAGHAGTLSDMPAFVTLGDETVNKIGNYFSLCEARIDTRKLTGEDILDFIVATEYSEWNDLFVYVINSLKKTCKDFIPVAAIAQQHKRNIERFLSSRPEYCEHLERIRKISPVWEEKILVVDDEEIITELISAILEGEGAIEVARDGKDALEKLTGKYYAAIITDIDMPRMNGIEFYRNAIRLFGNIGDRFLFFTGGDTPEHTEFFRENKINYLFKPSQIQNIRGAVVNILNRRYA